MGSELEPDGASTSRSLALEIRGSVNEDGPDSGRGTSEIRGAWGALVSRYITVRGWLGESEGPLYDGGNSKGVPYDGGNSKGVSYDDDGSVFT